MNAEAESSETADWFMLRPGVVGWRDIPCALALSLEDWNRAEKANAGDASSLDVRSAAGAALDPGPVGTEYINCGKCREDGAVTAKDISSLRDAVDGLLFLGTNVVEV
jgi:hypothetical protein